MRLLAGLVVLPVVLAVLALSGCGEAVTVSELPQPGTGQTIVLAWQAPTTNEDGSPLTDLAGYAVHYGPASGSYTTTVDVGSSTSCSLDISSSGTLYFVVTAYDINGNRSSFSNEVSQTF